MPVELYRPSLRDEWNAFNRKARNGHFIFDRDFMEYHADRFTDASLVVTGQGGRLLGLLPANRRGDTVFSHQGLTFGGLVVAEARIQDVMEALDLCAARWAADGAARLVYKPLPWIYHRRPSQEDLYWLYRREARLITRNTSATVRLANPGPVSERRRRGVGKALRADVTVRRADTFEGFWAVLEQVLAARHDAAPVHTLAEITRLAGRFPDNISLHVAETPAGEILAGVVLFRTPELLHTQYIATSEAGRACGALDHLFMQLLTHEAAGRTYFDFGTSNEDGGRAVNAGLIRQKEEFGASIVAHEVYELALP